MNKNSKGTLSLFAILYWMQAVAVITLKYTAVVSYTHTCRQYGSRIVMYCYCYRNTSTRRQIVTSWQDVLDCATVGQPTMGLPNPMKRQQHLIIKAPLRLLYLSHWTLQEASDWKPHGGQRSDKVMRGIMRYGLISMWFPCILIKFSVFTGGIRSLG